MRTFAYTNITTVVILCGPDHEDLSPIVRGNPCWTIPVLNTPLIEHTLKLLEVNGFKKAIMAISAIDNFDADQYIARLRGEHHGMELSFVVEDLPHGTAGSLRNIRRFVDGEGFVVLGGDIFLGNIDLAGMIASQDRKSVV